MLYFEIGPLSETHYTGIAQVTAGIAGEMLGDLKNEVRFFFGRQLIGNREVENVLKWRNGERLRWYARKANSALVPLSLNERSVGFFPNVKTVRRVFDYDVQVFHDLSALLTPQFHTLATVGSHGFTAKADLLSNDLTICVSEATRTDTLRYLRPPRPERVVTIHPGHSWPETLEATHEAAIGTPALADVEVEPFILVLGTIEPRKNIGVVLEYIERSPHILDSLRFVFAGRAGWGDQFAEYLERYDLLEPYEQRRILFTGFVSEQVKYSLMKEAQLVVYPSLFEGFGLPVLEALSLGTMVLTTRSSSLPEVGGDCCFYFDPFADDGFGSALTRALFELRSESGKMRERAKARAAQFSWPTFYKRALAEIAEVTDGAINA